MIRLDRIAPKQHGQIQALLNDKPYEGELQWTWRVNGPTTWEGGPFKGILTIGHDEWRLLLGRWRVRRRFVPDAVFWDGKDLFGLMVAGDEGKR